MTENEINPLDEERDISSNEEQTPESLSDELIPEQVEIPSPPQDVEFSKEESKLRQVSRRLLRWAMGLLAVFGLGAITAIVIIYQPTLARLNESKAALAEAQSEIKNLVGQIEDNNAEAQSKIDDLNKKIETISGLSETNQQLQEALEAESLHTNLLSALVDIHAAQYALAQEDLANAQIHLTNTNDKLEMIKTLMEETQGSAINNMLNRLGLVLDGIASEDVFAALSDLEVLSNGLVQLENSYFVNP